MEKFDVCMIAFANVSTDARTLNISRTLARNNLKVAVIGIGYNDVIKNDSDHDITFHNIAINPTMKTWQRWLDFYRKASIVAYDINADYIFAEDVYSLSVAAEMKKNNKAQLIYDSREIYSAIGSLSGRKLKQKFLAKFEKKHIRKVDKIVVTGERDAEYLRANLTNKKPYFIIKNLSPYKPVIESSKIRKRFHIQDDNKIIIYQGMLMNGRGIENCIDMMKDEVNLSFVIIGDGPLREQLQMKINEYKINHRVFLAGPVDYDELHSWTCSADIGLSLIEPVSKSYELALPNKMFEYTMAGIPTICTDLPAMHDIIEKYKIGIHIPVNSGPEYISQAISGILDNLEFYKNNCIAASKELSFDKQEQTVMELVK